jgi:hypothetical protein
MQGVGRMSQQAGWYPDPTDPVHYIRYWDGSKWTGKSKRMAPPNAPGQKLQDVGNSIAKTGVSIIVIVLSVLFLLFLFVLFI